MFDIIDYTKNVGYNLFANLPLTVLKTGASSVATVGGVALSAFSIISLGNADPVNRAASVILANYETNLLSNVYVCLLKVINPYAKYTNFQQHYTENNTISDLSKQVFGIFGYCISRNIFDCAKSASKSEIFFVRHVVSRLVYAVGAVVGPIARITDVAVGIIAGTISLIPCFGLSRKLNNFAISQLNLFVFQDLCKGLRGTFNPQQSFL